MPFDIQTMIIRVAVLLFAVTIHEYAHGKAALSLGDPTAKNAGRLTLNPVKHIDPLGAVCLFLFNFGWAKPVPVNTGYFKNRRRDTILMSISGPVSNLAAAFVAGIFIRNFLLPYELYLKLLLYMLVMNTGLGLFNLIPIPPLDGSHVLENILPPSFSGIFQQARRYFPMILLGVILLGNLYGHNILGRFMMWPIMKTAHFFGGDNFFTLMRVL